MTWIPFKCEFPDIVVLADEDRMLKEVREYIWNLLTYYNVNPQIVEAYYNRSMSCGVVKVISSGDEWNEIQPICFAVGDKIVIISFK
jgi:hypothetical protein